MKFIRILRRGGIPRKQIGTPNFEYSTNVFVAVDIPYPFHKRKIFNRFSESDAKRAINFYKEGIRINRNYRRRQRRYNKSI